jgi:uncharacterized protein
MGRITFGAMANLSALEAWFRAAGRVLVGYSGGVDSALLAVVGTRTLGAEALVPVLGRSASLGAAQHGRAVGLAHAYGLALVEVDTQELADPQYRANTPDRCFFCKHELWSRLHAAAASHGIACIVDGTHADDVGEHRPGGRAGAAHQVRSPFVELGWGKADVRAAARALGLPIWDAPSAPCLASRIRYGLEVSEERLGMVEAAERLLRTLGVQGDLRVRHLGEGARIETAPDQWPRIRQAWGRVLAGLRRLGFTEVVLDPTGYRRGALLRDAGVVADLTGAVTG